MSRADHVGAIAPLIGPDHSVPRPRSRAWVEGLAPPCGRARDVDRLAEAAGPRAPIAHLHRLAGRRLGGAGPRRTEVRVAHEHRQHVRLHPRVRHRRPGDDVAPHGRGLRPFRGSRLRVCAAAHVHARERRTAGTGAGHGHRARRGHGHRPWEWPAGRQDRHHVLPRHVGDGALHPRLRAVHVGGLPSGHVEGGVPAPDDDGGTVGYRIADGLRRPWLVLPARGGCLVPAGPLTERQLDHRPQVATNGRPSREA